VSLVLPIPLVQALQVVTIAALLLLAARDAGITLSPEARE
jgi:hypothetical protein